MNDRPSFEQRVGMLLRTIADEMPTGVDPTAVTRQAAVSRGDSRPYRIDFGTPGVMIGVALLLLALLIGIVGGVVGGVRPFQPEPQDILTERALVEPFIGLPPQGTPRSTPETGELVLAFAGRVPHGHAPVRFTRVFVDGRLITGTEAGRVGYHVVEQYLTPEGVELMRSAALSDTILDADLDNLNVDDDPAASGGGPGADWDWLQVQIGEQRFQVGWSDPDLPARLVDAGSWLPEHAWSDRRAMPYVASRYAVCVEALGPRSAAEVFEVLPASIKGLIRSRAIEDTPRRDDPRCLYEVTTADARVIAATLDGTLADGGDVLEWRTRKSPLRNDEVNVELLRVLPDGSSVCYCG
jgi:hypothetical protein